MDRFPVERPPASGGPGARVYAPAKGQAGAAVEAVPQLASGQIGLGGEVGRNGGRWECGWCAEAHPTACTYPLPTTGFTQFFNGVVYPAYIKCGRHSALTMWSGADYKLASF